MHTRYLPGSRLFAVGAACLVMIPALILAACVPAAPAPLVLDTPTATATLASPTPTIDWFPDTATPTLPPTPAVTPTPDLLPEKGELILEDDFSDPKTWQTLQTASGSMAFGNQVLTLAISSGKTSLVSFRSGPTLGDYYLEITASPSLCRGSDNYGLLLRTASEKSFYRWIITCEGSLRLERLRDGMPAVLQDWTPAVARPGADQLAVWLSGSEMRFYIDGILQFSLRDPVFTSGGIGVFARSGGENALTVNFSNLKVYRVSPQPGPAASQTPEIRGSLTP